MTEREPQTHARDRAARRHWLAANHARQREWPMIDESTSALKSHAGHGALNHSE